MRRLQQLSPARGARPGDRRSDRRGDRLRGLAVTVLLLLLVVGFPLVLIAIGAAPWDANLNQVRPLLTGPDDGTLALVVVAVVGWIAWIAVAVSVVLAVVAELRGLRAPTIPGFALPQQTAAQLVAVAALLFVATPTVLAAFPTPLAHAAVTAPVVEKPRLESATVDPAVPTVAPRALVDEAPIKHKQATIDYTVRRGDSLWKIAERLLGDGTRYTEIVDLNRTVLGGRPDFITPGTVLKIPHEVTEPATNGPSDEEYVVRPGDTLSGIAEARIGDAHLYSEIFEASRATEQPDGMHLSDPNLIRPGWKLTIPTVAPKDPAAVTPPKHAEPPTEITPPAVPDPAGHQPTRPSVQTPTSTPTSEPTVQPRPETPAAHGMDGSEQVASPGWLLPGLTGAGVLLAGSVLIAIRAHRRTQQRYRRPGFTIAAPPPEVRAVEKTATVTGAPAAEVIDQLDRMFRHLAARADPMPRLDAVEVDQRSVTLHLAASADLPQPWSGAETQWTADLDSPMGDEDQLSPYPLLASVGQSDDGHLWLLNLEHLGAIALTGDAEHARALARHLAAELALSPWAVISEIDTIEVAPELTTLDPGRLRHHATGDTGFLDRLYKDLDQAQQAGFGDPEPFRALLAAGARSEKVRALAELVRTQDSRSGFALVTLLAPAEEGDVVLELTPDRRLRVPLLGLDLAAAGLTVTEAEACAAIVDLTRDAAVVPMPREVGATGWRALADQAGALVEGLVEQRPAGAAGATSLLPEASQRYEAVAATTADDVEALAPVVPEQTRWNIEQTDPQLDADLTEWHNPESRLPKLRLLGPVTATANRAVVPQVVERKAYFTELVTYLALHPAGVSSRQVREAFGMSQSRARTDLSFVRTWFGVSPRTGMQHLPLASTSPAHTDRGTNGYQLNDILVDLDLFCRLRVRGQARGPDGMADLVAALELVTGEPFSSLRDPGWSWLLDDERAHETTVFMVVDVAHVVATDALSRGDLARARFAAETGCKAAPYDEVCRLDLARVAEADGHTELADQILDDHVFNRTDDHLPPIDLPERTAEVVKNHDWGHRRRPKNA